MVNHRGISSRGRILTHDVARFYSILVRIRENNPHSVGIRQKFVMTIDPFRLHTHSTCLVEFINSNPDLVSPDNAMAFISDDGGETYNRCHCESFVVCYSDVDLYNDYVQSGAISRSVI